MLALIIILVIGFVISLKMVVGAYERIIEAKDKVIEENKSDKKIFKSDAEKYQKAYVDELKEHTRERDSTQMILKKLLELQKPKRYVQ